MAEIKHHTDANDKVESTHAKADGKIAKEACQLLNDHAASCKSPDSANKHLPKVNLGGPEGHTTDHHNHAERTPESRKNPDDHTETRKPSPTDGDKPLSNKPLGDATPNNNQRFAPTSPDITGSLGAKSDKNGIDQNEWDKVGRYEGGKKQWN